MHHNLENSTCHPLKYTMGSPIHNATFSNLYIIKKRLNVQYQKQHLVIKYLIVPDLFQVKQWDIVFGIPSFCLSFHPLSSSRYLVFATPLTIYAKSFESLQVFRSWSEGVHMFRYNPQIILLLFSQVEISHCCSQS